MLALLFLLNSGCVKDEWSKPDVLGIATPDKAVSTLDENFNQASSVDGQHLIPPKGWYNTGREGWHRAYQTGVIANSDNAVVRCAAASGYLALDSITDAWLITPPLKIEANKRFTYTAAYGYNNSRTQTVERATVEVRYYTTSSTSATAPDLSNLDDWKLYETLSAKEPYIATSAIWFMFYDQTCGNLSNLAKLNADDDVIYIAFRYFVAPQKGNSTNSWYFDDVKYN